MKKLLTLILIVISYSVGMGQQSVPVWSPFVYDTILIATDTLTASRFIEDSIGNGYEIEYRFVMSETSATPRATLLYTPDVFNDKDSLPSLRETIHTHYISLVNIIAFKGNKQHTIASNIKAIYSPVECVSDNRELWLKRLYEFQNKKK